MQWNTQECPTLPYKSWFWKIDLSLSLSLLLRRAISLSLSLSTFTTCYQSLQTVWIQKIVRHAWSGANMHTKSYNLVRLCVRWSPHAERNISDKYLLSDACHGRIQTGTGVRTPLEKIKKNIGFPSNIDPDPLTITKPQSQHSMVGHYRQWRFADGPMVV